MLPTQLFIGIQREVDLLADLLTVSHRQLSLTSGYEGDHLYVRGYIEEKEEPTEHSYYHDMLKPSMESFAALMNNVKYMEFEKLPCAKPGEGPIIQIVGGGPDYGFWLRKTTTYEMFGILGDQCPEHVAKPEFGGYFGSDDVCPEDCDFEPKFKGLKPGYQTIYDVLVRSSPRLQVK